MSTSLSATAAAAPRGWLRRLRPLLAAALMALATLAAAIEPIEYRSAEEEARYRMLISQLRCVMCQNESLADSDAQIAIDLRREVLVQIRDGRSDREIEQFLVDRYGEFVLYRPRLTPMTYALWFGPLALAVLGMGLIVRQVRRRSAKARVAPLPDSEDGSAW
jgi:cytochrome c-type biogenesis protein CcmH